MNNFKFTLTATQVFGGNTAIVTQIAEARKYVDGKFTDELDGFKVTVVADADKSFDKFVVKVAQKPEITQEQIDASEVPIRVSFKDFAGKLYTSFKSNSTELSCRASEVVVVKGR